LNFSPNITKIIKSRKIRATGYVAWEIRERHVAFLVGTSEVVYGRIVMKLVLEK
jgi:hypothetical protein